MLGALHIATALAAASAAVPANTAKIDVTEREPLSLFLTAPTGEISNTSRSEVYQIIAELLRERTTFTLRALETTPAIEKCEGRLGCIALEAQAARWLLMLSIKTGAAREDRISAILIDTEEAARRRRPDAEEFEALVFEHALLAQPSPIVLRARADVEPSLERLIFRELPRSFIEQHDARAFGALQLACDRANVSIELDGSLIGATAAGVTEISGLTSGVHHIVLSHADWETWAADVTIEAGGRAQLDARLLARGTERAETERAVIFWSGIGAAAAGAALSVAAVVIAESRTEMNYCIGTPGACDSSPAFFARAGEAEASSPLDLGPRGGVPLLPLAMGFGVAGGTWVIGSLLDGEAAPWIALGLGVALGAGTIALTTALEPPRP